MVDVTRVKPVETLKTLDALNKKDTDEETKPPNSSEDNTGKRGKNKVVPTPQTKMVNNKATTHGDIEMGSKLVKRESDELIKKLVPTIQDSTPIKLALNLDNTNTPAGQP